MDKVVKRSAPITGEFPVPGDKSISHRALILGSLCKGTSRFQNISLADDPRSTADCLRALGVDIRIGGTEAVVQGRGLTGLQESTAPLDAGNSGTTLRLLSGILAGYPFETRLTGDDSLRRRPMQRIIDPLTSMGAEISSNGGRAPLSVRGRFPLKPISYNLPVPSAQVKSAVLLAGLFADGRTTVTERIPSRDHTERLLGLKPSQSASGTSISIQGGHSFGPFDMTIPGDISSAVYLLCAAALVPGSNIIISNVGLNLSRAHVLDVLDRAGLIVKRTVHRSQEPEPRGDLAVTYGPLAGPLRLDGEAVPLLIDELPALAVLAAASGVACSIRGAAELRTKESDRIALLTRNLRILGVDVAEYPDGLEFPATRQLNSGVIETGADHRMAMAFSLAGLIIPGGVTLRDAESVSVSFPGFWSVVDAFQST